MGRAGSRSSNGCGHAGVAWSPPTCRSMTLGPTTSNGRARRWKHSPASRGLSWSSGTRSHRPRLHWSRQHARQRCWCMSVRDRHVPDAGGCSERLPTGLPVSSEGRRRPPVGLGARRGDRSDVPSTRTANGARPRRTAAARRVGGRRLSAQPASGCAHRARLHQRRRVLHAGVGTIRPPVNCSAWSRSRYPAVTSRWRRAPNCSPTCSTVWPPKPQHRPTLPRGRAASRSQRRRGGGSTGSATTRPSSCSPTIRCRRTTS